MIEINCDKGMHCLCWQLGRFDEPCHVCGAVKDEENAIKAAKAMHPAGGSTRNIGDDPVATSMARAMGATDEDIAAADAVYRPGMSFEEFAAGMADRENTLAENLRIGGMNMQAPGGVIGQLNALIGGTQNGRNFKVPDMPPQEVVRVEITVMVTRFEGNDVRDQVTQTAAWGMHVVEGQSMRAVNGMVFERVEEIRVDFED